MDKRLVTAIALLVLVFIGLGATWWLGRGTDQRKVDQAAAEFSAALREKSTEPPADADPATDPADTQVVRLRGAEVPESMRNLDAEQREQLAERMVPEVMNTMFERLQAVLDLPPNQQTAALDRAIDQQLNASQQMDELSRSTVDEAARTGVAVRTRQAGDGQTEVRRVVDGSSEAGERFMADHTTPEQRAVLDAYADLMRARMKERGINAESVPIRFAVGIETTAPTE